MDFILYFNSTMMMLVLFAGAIIVVSWSAKKLWRATHRLLWGAEDEKQKKRLAGIRDQWDPNHPSHYKRAGQ
jgi:hypothetical protein